MHLKKLSSECVESHSSWADFSSFPLDLYDRLHLPIQTASGCSWSCCAFCSEPTLSKEYTSRHFDEVLAQIIYLQQTHKKASYYFVDNNLNADSKRLTAICRHLAKDRTSLWTCMVRSKDLTEPLLRDMKSSGCRNIFVGLESLSDNTLKAMNKGCTKLDHLRAFRLAQEVGISLEGNFMIGFPAETPEDIKETIKTIQCYDHLWRSCRFWTSSFAATPGSKIYNNPEKYGIRIHDWGDETENIPETICGYVPIWHYHWSHIEEDKKSSLEKCRLYHKLESIVHLIQEYDLPRQYYREDLQGISIFSEIKGRTDIIKTCLTKLQSRIFKSCMDIRLQDELLQMISIEPDKLISILFDMEQRGWIAISNNKIVTTVPYVRD